MSHKRDRRRNGPDLSFPYGSFVRMRDELLAILSKSANDDFASRYLASEVLSKYVEPDPSGSENRKSKAIEKWLRMERRNAETNVRLFFDTARICGVSTDKIVRYARVIVRSVIGSAPPESFPKVTFTNGASTRVRRAPNAAALKFEGKPHATQRALNHLKMVESELWSTLCPDSVNPEVVRGSVLFTVPKNAEIDRVACKEPEINMILQRSVGLFMRDCLKKVGINLDDQRVNQRLARRGSLDGSLATLDLSSASDLISRTLVHNLLPLDWYMLLDDIRVHETLIDGEWHELEMFSSMGNGFTFELESLLFYALSKSICRSLGIRGRISVYGDDIVVPAAVAGSFHSFFSWFGFKVNTKKSFWKGRFRESCGKHYYAGQDVSPFYIREPILDMEKLIHFLNRFREWSVRTDPWATRLCTDLFVTEEFLFWRRWACLVPSQLWGGQDVERTDALVTGHAPRLVLRHARVKKSSPQLGAYLLWHASTECLDLVPSRRVVSDPRLDWRLSGRLYSSNGVETSSFFLDGPLVIRKRISVGSSWNRDRNLSVPRFLAEMARAGLDSLPSGRAP